ncbi:hypothetical protein POUND7_007470 [Theobroma cacao]
MSYISRNTNNPSSSSSSSSRFGGQDGVVEALHLLAWTASGFDWYVLNLENGVISQTLSRMPPKARRGSTAVACGNQIFVLGGACGRDPTCPDGKIHEIHLHDYVFYFDYQHPENGWREVSPMLLQRMKPSAVTLDGKIYVFGGSAVGRFAEVLDIGQNSRALLRPPYASNIDPVSVSYPVLLDSSRSRILVHFACNNSLYAYNVNDKSWHCLNENFGKWSFAAVIVDDVLYGLVDSREDLYCFSETECSLRGYEVVENKHLPAKWLPEFQVCVPNHADLFQLGNGNLCLAWYSELEMHFYYIKFNVCKNSGEVHATGESDSVTCVEFQTSYCQISLLELKSHSPEHSILAI